MTNETLKSSCLLVLPHCAGRRVLVGTQMGWGQPRDIGKKLKA